jgi:2-haloacid dehalogenase
MAAGAATTNSTLPRIRAVAFDAFTIFDGGTPGELAKQLFVDRGVGLATLWRTRQFEYTWLRTLTARYADFETVTRDALTFAAKSIKLDLDDARAKQLNDTYLNLGVHADSKAALQKMKDAGLRLVFLSNMTSAMLAANVTHSGLEGLFERALTTDAVKAYKPDPRAYQMAVDALGLSKQEIVFAAFGGWDATGAKTFGYPTFWVNRNNVPPEELGVAADATAATLTDLANFVIPLAR